MASRRTVGTHIPTVGLFVGLPRLILGSLFCWYSTPEAQGLSKRTYSSRGMRPLYRLTASHGFFLSSSTIGGGGRSFDAFRACAGDSGHTNGSSTYVSGPCAVLRSSSSARNTARWPSASCARPSGCP